MVFKSLILDQALFNSQIKFSFWNRVLAVLGKGKISKKGDNEGGLLKNPTQPAKQSLIVLYQISEKYQYFC
jgi:hypothetical protein